MEGWPYTQGMKRLGILAVALLLAGCAAEPPTSERTEQTAAHEPFCDVYDRNADAYAAAVDAGDADTIAGLSIWADDLEYNVAPGYATIAEGYVAPIRQASDAKADGAAGVTLDLGGFVKGVGEFGLGCVGGEVMTSRLDHDSDATP